MLLCKIEYEFLGKHILGRRLRDLGGKTCVESDDFLSYETTDLDGVSSLLLI